MSKSKTSKADKSYKFASKNIIILAAISGVILIGLSAIYYCSLIPKFDLKYIIKPVSSEKSLIRVDLLVNNGFDAKGLEFYKAESKPIGIEVSNARGESLVFSDQDGLIKISATAFPIHVRYYVHLGELEKHGHRGAVYDDLLCFDGAQVLLFPTQAYTGQEANLEKYFGHVSITYDVPSEWKAIIPFSQPVSKKELPSSELRNLDWSKIYELQKACYAFGPFIELENPSKSGLRIFQDPASRQNLSNQTIMGINQLYLYYASIIKDSSPDLDVLVLRRDPTDQVNIMGGTGVHAVGASFEPGNTRDWELLGHRFFHAFFDSAWQGSLFHQPGHLWLYEGLATYYETMSVESLSPDLKGSLNFSANMRFAALFTDYLYMKEKDKTLDLIPMQENKFIESEAQTEFMHYTQAPLIVKSLEDLSVQATGVHDRLIHYILDNQTTPDKLSIDNLFRSSLGTQGADFYRSYVAGNTLLPMWGLPRLFSAKATLSELNDMEILLWSWFRLDDPEYPRDMMDIQGLRQSAIDAEHQGIHFDEAVIEAKIKEWSPICYQLLLQYALRADICKINPADPLLRFKLLADPVNIKKWQDYKSSRGWSGN